MVMRSRGIVHVHVHLAREKQVILWEMKQRILGRSRINPGDDQGSQGVAQE